jgi:transcription-repair coupling factor (superfamily II helicase)
LIIFAVAKMSRLTNPYIDHPFVPEIIQSIRESTHEVYALKGLAGSARAALLHAVMQSMKGNHLVVFQDKEEAAYFYTDLVNLEGDADRTLFFPSSYKRSVQYHQTDEANIITRTRTLKRLNEQRVSNFIITYAEALIEKVLTRAELGRHTLQVKQGESISRDFLEEVLRTYQFQLVDFVYEPGQYAIRGGIVDVFSYAASHPHRIDFFGDEVDSIRPFDVESQRSSETVKSCSIIPNVQWEQDLGEKRISFLQYIPSNTTLWLDTMEIVLERIGAVYGETILKDNNEVGVEKEEYLADREATDACLQLFNRLEFNHPAYPSPAGVWEFRTTPQPVFQKNFKLLAQTLKENIDKQYTNYILSENSGQFERLKSIFNEIDPEATFREVSTALHEGFADADLKVAMYTDHQIFERYHKFRLWDQFTKKEALSVKELSSLNPGDYVVHVDHGIGIFGGLEKITINDRVQEAIRLVYKDNDVLFVNIHSLHRISKYKGKEGQTPRVYKLGTGTWQKLKQKTKSKVKDIANELIALYAQRKAQAGFAFSSDSYLQKELEASFIYEDTPDQYKAVSEVKKGMEAPYPMDSLVCGDVGFGKTEVAIRAAFKAVADSKQVAVLVPTTVLAFQHFNTFRSRLKGFPCSVDYISRLRTASEQKAVLRRLTEGSLDIVIGTHKLVGESVKFKDLGLLIIDEEQKFGVSVKEKLKRFKLNVDTLTLTATPIPRTLQFSLMGARDLSIINTPPPNRHPIITELHPFNEKIIKEAIEYEVSRGGQVFFIHNRVQNISEVKQLVDRLVPGIRSIIAHGQMEGKSLEDVMLSFMAGEYDVLIATTIVESGLDIPNTNTIIINNAHHFGLSDLHQLRGRVGRSNKKAFCYLFAPPVTTLTPEARRRLKAISEFSSLGSGFNIALQDLDIRGAGNLLGAEQSGFIADIGFETYQRILNEAIQELKDEVYSDVFDEQRTQGEPSSRTFVQDCQVDTDHALLLPDSYVSNISERMNLYRELDQVNDEQGLEDFRQMLTDRFGSLPAPAEELLRVVPLRWLAMKTGVEKIILKNNTLITYFVSNPESLFYRSEMFTRVIHNIQRNPKLFRMRQDGDRLSLRINNIGSIAEAVGIIEQLQSSEQ